MKTEAKPNSKPAKKTATITKPEGKPKIVLGTGKHLAFISDTLFDDDLKQ